MSLSLLSYSPANLYPDRLSFDQLLLALRARVVRRGPLSACAVSVDRGGVVDPPRTSVCTEFDRVRIRVIAHIAGSAARVESEDSPEERAERTGAGDDETYAVLGVCGGEMWSASSWKRNGG